MVCGNRQILLRKTAILFPCPKTSMKSPNEAVVKSIGSMLQKYMKLEQNATQSVYEDEIHIDWNGPVI